MTRLRMILTPVGSSGDMHPFIGIGRALRQRGHEVILVASGKFRPIAERHGLRLIDVLPAEEYDRLTQDPELWHPRRGVATVMKSITDRMRPTYHGLGELHEPGRTIIVGHSVSIATRVFADAHPHTPEVTIHLAPAVLRTDYDAPVITHGVSIKRMPRWVKRAFWWLADALIINPHLVPELNGWRAELGLPRVSRPFNRWLHSPQRVICMWPEWFAAKQRDWGPHIHLAGFPLWDEAGDHVLPDEVERFLAAGDKPIAFTPRSAMRHGRAFFEAAIGATQRLNRRALLLTQYAEQLPPQLPPHVRHVRYAPFSELLPRCAAVVHHGGIGSSAQRAWRLASRN